MHVTITQRVHALTPTLPSASSPSSASATPLVLFGTYVTDQFQSIGMNTIKQTCASSAFRDCCAQYRTRVQCLSIVCGPAQLRQPVKRTRLCRRAASIEGARESSPHSFPFIHSFVNCSRGHSNISSAAGAAICVSRHKPLHADRSGSYI